MWFKLLVFYVWILETQKKGRNALLKSTSFEILNEIEGGFQTKKLKKWMMEIKLNSWSLVWAIHPWIWTLTRHQNTEQSGRQGGWPVRHSNGCWHTSTGDLDVAELHLKSLSHVEQCLKLESATKLETATSDWFCNFPKILNQKWEGKLSLSLSLKLPLFHSLHSDFWHVSVICTHNRNTMNNVQGGLSESVCRYPCIYMINHV